MHPAVWQVQMDHARAHFGRDPITAAQEAEEPPEREQEPHRQALGAGFHLSRGTHHDSIRPCHLSSTVGKILAQQILPIASPVTFPVRTPLPQLRARSHGVLGRPREEHVDGLVVHESDAEGDAVGVERLREVAQRSALILTDEGHRDYKRRHEQNK